MLFTHSSEEANPAEEDLSAVVDIIAPAFNFFTYRYVTSDEHHYTPVRRNDLRMSKRLRFYPRDHSRQGLRLPHKLNVLNVPPEYRLMQIPQLEKIGKPS